MKRHLIFGLSAICLMLTACGEKKDSSLPAMPRNTAGMTETTEEATTAPFETLPLLTTVSVQTTSLTSAGSSQNTSRTVQTFTTMTTTKKQTAYTTATTTQYIPPATTAAKTTVLLHTTSLTTTESADPVEEAEQIARKLQEDLFLAEIAVQSAKSALSEANTAHEAAQQAADTFKKEHEAELARYSQGSKGFFSFVNAVDALDVLENAKYSSNTHIGEEDDATSLDNMFYSIAYIKKCNTLRESEGLMPLTVTDKMMAIAQSNLNWSDEFVQHSRQFSVEENLAWGYADDDPFSGWYDGEKEIHGVHYQNIVNPEFIVTGFAICSADRSGRYSASHGQVFDISDDDDTAYTADEYEARFKAYYDSVQEVQTEYAVLQKAVTDAQASAAGQMLAVSQAEQALHEADEAYKKAEERLAELLNQ